METRNYKGTDLNISLLGLGCMRLPKLYTDKEDIDYEKAQQIVDYAYSHGINYYDTAYPYHKGTSEKFIGTALKKYPRQSFCLATKMPIWSIQTKEDAQKIFYEQLKNCQVNYFDFYLLHAVKEDNFQKYIDLSYDFLCKMKKEGKIKYLGFSFHDKPEVLQKICDEYDWDFAQIQLNYLDWEFQDAKQQYEILENHNIPCIIMEPVKGGTLANPCEEANKLFKEARPNESIASWAIRYVASLKNVLVVLSGMSNMEQIKDNIKTVESFEALTKADYDIIDKAVKAYKLKDTIPCTGCRYCMDCSFGVDIPKMFDIYNKYCNSRDIENYKKEYKSIKSNETANNCKKCKACIKHCPQNINIPEKLEMINEFNKKLFA